MGNDEGIEKLILFSKNFSFNKKSKDLVDCKQDILNLLSKYIVNFDDLIETKFLTPADLKETFYFPKGNIDHMTLSGNQNFDKRTFSNQPKESFLGILIMIIFIIVELGHFLVEVWQEHLDICVQNI